MTIRKKQIDEQIDDYFQNKSLYNQFIEVIDNFNTKSDEFEPEAKKMLKTLENFEDVDQGFVSSVGELFAQRVKSIVSPDKLGVVEFIRTGEFPSGVHIKLDILGLIPGVGAIPDLANAALYLLEGEMVNASMSGVAAIPVAGYSAIASKYSAKAINSFSDVFKYGDEMFEIGAKNSDNIWDYQKFRTKRNDNSNFVAKYTTKWSDNSNSVVKYSTKWDNMSYAEILDAMSGTDTFLDLSLKPAAEGAIRLKTGEYTAKDIAKIGIKEITEFIEITIKGAFGFI